MQPEQHSSFTYQYFLNPRYAETESLYTQAPGVKDLVAEFESLGGSVLGFATTVLRVMLLSCCCESIAACCVFPLWRWQVTFMPCSEIAAANPEMYQVWIQETDTIMSICIEGKNRSQVAVIALLFSIIAYS